MTAIPIEGADLAAVAAEATRTHEPVQLTDSSGRAVAAVIDAEQLYGLYETLEILADPDEARAVLAAIAEARGSNESAEFTAGQLAELIARR